MESALVIEPARSLDAVGHASVQTIETPLGEGDADYRDLEDITLHHGIECREDHLVGEIAGYTEEHQRVGTGARHQARPFLAVVFCSCLPNCESSRIDQYISNDFFTRQPLGSPGHALYQLGGGGVAHR